MLVKIFLYCFWFISSVWTIVPVNHPLAADRWLQILLESIASVSSVGRNSGLKGGEKGLLLSSSLSSALKHYQPCPQETSVTCFVLMRSGLSALKLLNGVSCSSLNLSFA